MGTRGYGTRIPFYGAQRTGERAEANAAGHAADAERASGDLDDTLADLRKVLKSFERTLRGLRNVIQAQGEARRSAAGARA